MTSTTSTAVMETPTRGVWTDWAGMVASIGCAIHCAAMPLVLAYLPALGLGWLASEGFHQWMAGICFLLAASAFVPGWRKHGSFLPSIWGAAGLLLLTTAAFALEDSCCAHGNPGDHASLAGTDVECASCLLTEGEKAVGGSTSVASLTPFVTPLGGLLLVVGHVLNHLKSCRCQGNSCCLSYDGRSQSSKFQ